MKSTLITIAVIVFIGGGCLHAATDSKLSEEDSWQALLAHLESHSTTSIRESRILIQWVMSFPDPVSTTGRNNTLLVANKLSALFTKCCSYRQKHQECMKKGRGSSEAPRTKPKALWRKYLEKIKPGPLAKNSIEDVRNKMEELRITCQDVWSQSNKETIAFLRKFLSGSNDGYLSGLDGFLEKEMSKLKVKGAGSGAGAGGGAGLGR